MFTKVVKAVKLIAIPLLFIIAIISCEGDIEDVGVGVLDKGLFDTKELGSKVISYNQNDLEVKANNLGQYLLGVYRNDDFGQINAGLAGQLTFFSSIDFGTAPAIDSVILNPVKELIGEINQIENEVSTELLEMLIKLAQRGPTLSLINADTSVGRTLETALGIDINSSKLPVYPHL